MKVHTILICSILSTICLTSISTGSEADRIEVPFTTTQTGHITIALKINNLDAKFGVDTAAGVNLIAEKKADHLGIKLKRSRRKVGGLAGGGLKTYDANIDSLTINGVEYQSPPFLAVDLYLGQPAEMEKLSGVIGAPFLLKHGAVIDYEKKVISFAKPENS